MLRTVPLVYTTVASSSISADAQAAIDTHAEDLAGVASRYIGPAFFQGRLVHPMGVSSVGKLVGKYRNDTAAFWAGVVFDISVDAEMKLVPPIR